MTAMHCYIFSRKVVAMEPVTTVNPRNVSGNRGTLLNMSISVPIRRHASGIAAPPMNKGRIVARGTQTTQFMAKRHNQRQIQKGEIHFDCCQMCIGWV